MGQLWAKEESGQLPPGIATMEKNKQQNIRSYPRGHRNEYEVMGLSGKGNNMNYWGKAMSHYGLSLGTCPVSPEYKEGGRER